jgi:3-hydroxyacyl-CoA dehydrogenase
VGSNLGLAICSNQRSCYTESYLGVVDLGLGLIPVGGVTNELLKKLDQEIAPGDPENNRLSFLHENFTFKKISSSALTAKRNGLLDLRENLIFNPKKTILDAKNKIIQLNKKGFVSDSINTKITARGSQSLAVLYTQTENLKESGFLTDYDKRVSDKYSFLLCGGDVSERTKADESYFLNLEKEIYMELCSEPKTIERVGHFIKNKNLLRN